MAVWTARFGAPVREEARDERPTEQRLLRYTRQKCNYREVGGLQRCQHLPSPQSAAVTTKQTNGCKDYRWSEKKGRGIAPTCLFDLSVAAANSGHTCRDATYSL
jgi:hypothetical protein